MQQLTNIRYSCAFAACGCLLPFTCGLFGLLFLLYSIRILFTTVKIYAYTSCSKQLYSICILVDEVLFRHNGQNIWIPVSANNYSLSSYSNTNTGVYELKCKGNTAPNRLCWWQIYGFLFDKYGRQESQPPHKSKNSSLYGSDYKMYNCCPTSRILQLGNLWLTKITLHISAYRIQLEGSHQKIPRIPYYYLGPKKTSRFSLHRIFKRMHEILNIDKK